MSPTVKQNPGHSVTKLTETLGKQVALVQLAAPSRLEAPATSLAFRRMVAGA